MNYRGETDLLIQGLRRQNRLLRAILILILMGFVGVLLMGAYSPKTIEAEKFILRDSAGKPRAMIGITNEGPAIVLNDEQGRPRVKLIVPQTGLPKLQRFDEHGKLIE